MEIPVKPTLLLADSQLLFWQAEGGPFLARIRRELPDRPRAAYLGASNGDLPEYYEIFAAAMETIGVSDCRQIPSCLEADDRNYLDAADLILLAGGDVRRGWRSFEQQGLAPKLIERYYQGAVLVGVSAGAVQLGLKGWSEDAEGRREYFDTLRLVPWIVDVHDQPDWKRLGALVRHEGGHARGIGIPAGGGALVHPDLTIEPIRHPLAEFGHVDQKLQQALLFPPTGEN